MPPTPPATDGTLFQSYVAIGNSITAGFQSGGINDSTQREAYPVLLAQQMGHTIGATFNAPFMNAPGCPPPFTNIFTQTRLAGAGATDCFLRARPVASTLHNVAVPGAAVINALTNLDPASDPNALTTFFLGGRTQLEAAADAAPTFATVWIGNNDVLGSILDAADPGTAALVTDPADFASGFDDLMDELGDLGVQGGVVIGVVQVAFVPYLTQGRVWEQFEQQFDMQTAPLNALDVTEANCFAFQPISPTDTVWASVPFPYGGAQLAEASAKIDSVQNGTLSPLALEPAVIDCSVAQAVTVPELLNLVSAVTQYNAAAQASAQGAGFVFVDPNPLLLQLAQDPAQIRPFPAFDPADPQHTTAPFGAALSRDGIHPSAAAHKLVADAVIQATNAAYGTSLAPVP